MSGDDIVSGDVARDLLRAGRWLDVPTGDWVDVSNALARTVVALSDRIGEALELVVDEAPDVSEDFAEGYYAALDAVEILLKGEAP